MQNTYRANGSSPRTRRALLVRAGVAQRFGSLITFFSAMLLAYGGYELVQAIIHPLEAQGTEVISAAVLIALASFMLFYVIEARSAAYASQRGHRHGKIHLVERSLTVTALLAQDAAASPSKLPLDPAMAIAKAPVTDNGHPLQALGMAAK